MQLCQPSGAMANSLVKVFKPECLCIHSCFHMFFCILGVTTHIDDEYQMAGVDDPKILITTSRNPSARLKMFAKVIASCLA
jgi:hypothetical protein